MTKLQKYIVNDFIVEMYVSYTLPVNSNVYVSFFINSLDSIVRASNLQTVSDGGTYSVEVVWRGCWEAQYSCHAADPPQAWWGRPPGSNRPWMG